VGIWVALVLALTGSQLLDDAFHFFRTGSAAFKLFDGDLANFVMLFTSVGCLGRAWLRPDAARRVWLAFGAAQLSFFVGDILWYFFLGADNAPNPSIADAFYLGFSALLVVGIVGYCRLVVGNAAAVYDAAVAGLAAAALAAALFFPYVGQLFSSSLVSTFVNVLYPMADVVIFAVMIATVAAAGWRVDRTLVCMAASVAVLLVTDVVYIAQANTYSMAGFLDDGWFTAGTMLSLTCVFAPARERVRQRAAARPTEARTVVVTTLVAFGCLAVVLVRAAYGSFGDILATSLALAAITVVVVRMLGAVRANARLMGRLEDDSVTDALTLLGNRRRLTRDLEQQVAAGAHITLVMFDLDAFKRFNDTFGHPAGDALLRRLGARLELAANAYQAQAYRLGGDEFCLVAATAADERRGLALLTGALAALRVDAGEFQVTASWGVARFPSEAEGPSALMSAADARLYANKFHRRSSSNDYARQMLTMAVTERNPALGEKASIVGQLAVMIGERLGLGELELRDLERAGQLSEIGKIAVPDSILAKPGRLEPDEWEQMRRHTSVAERIIAIMPELRGAAGIVRSSHEAWDGSGYPDQLAGEDIPLASRIVYVASAVAAMLAPSTYREAVQLDEAMAELRRCAGTQFDPRVVERACAALVDLRADGEVGAGAPEGSDRLDEAA
jgi:diguanylate cyclase (GGDEF)-like protein